MKTNIYHITYTPATRSASLRFWGCNMDCRGCLCKKEVYDSLLKENLLVGERRSKSNIEPPKKFLDFDEVMKLLSELELEKIYLTGEEATVDPHFGDLTKAFRERLGTRNSLYTNGYKMPVIDYIDQVEVGIKAYSDELHRDYTGRPVKKVLDNFVKYHQAGKELTAASIVIPGYVDADEVEQVARFVAGVDKSIPYFLLPYFPAGDNPWRKTTEKEVAAAVKLAEKHLENVCGCKGNQEELLYEVVKVF